jgi:hypothetical protein
MTLKHQELLNPKSFKSFKDIKTVKNFAQVMVKKVQPPLSHLSDD